jgi:hypothetical protein
MTTRCQWHAPLGPKDGGRDWSPLLIMAMRGSNAWTRGSLVFMTRAQQASNRYGYAFAGVAGGRPTPLDATTLCT